MPNWVCGGQSSIIAWVNHRDHLAPWKPAANADSMPARLAQKSYLHINSWNTCWAGRQNLCISLLHCCTAQKGHSEAICSFIVTSHLAQAFCSHDLFTKQQIAIVILSGAGPLEIRLQAYGQTRSSMDQDGEALQTLGTFHCDVADRKIFVTTVSKHVIHLGKQS